MTLYDDLPPPSKTEKDERSAWSAPLLSPPVVVPALSRKPPVLPPPAVLRAASRGAAPVQQVPPRSLPRPAPPVAPPLAAAAAAAAASHRPQFVEVLDEYDPATPNSYDDVLRSRALKRKAVELESKRRALEVQRTELAARRKAEAAQPLPPPPPLPHLLPEPLPPPPPLPQLPSLPVPVEESPAEGGGAPSVAQRLMQRMGWKQGQGLGPSNEGITEPLVLRKVGKHAGIVVTAPPLRPVPAAADQQPISRILCLRGVVQPGGVDERLEDEVASECELFGPIVRVLIFEAEDAATLPIDEQVRIFVEFVSTQGAVAARAEMDGRFFGGRLVHASFFPEQRYDLHDFL